MLKRFIYCTILTLTISFLNLMIINQSNANPKTGQKRIAILELVNRTKNDVSQIEVQFLTNEMRRVTGFLPTSEFLVMTKESIMVLIDPNTNLEECVGSCEVETGRAIGADFILTGEVIRFGKSLRVSVKLHDTRSGQYLAGDSLKGSNVEELELPVQLASLKLIYKISPRFQIEMTRKAGSKLNDQLNCLTNFDQCKVQSIKNTNITNNKQKISSQVSKPKTTHKRENRPEKKKTTPIKNESTGTSLDLISVGVPFLNGIIPDFDLTTGNFSLELFRIRGKGGIQFTGLTLALSYDNSCGGGDGYGYGNMDTCSSAGAGMLGLAGLGFYKTLSSQIFEFSSSIFPLGVLGLNNSIYIFPIQTNIRTYLEPTFFELSILTGLLEVEGDEGLFFLPTINFGIKL